MNKTFYLDLKVPAMKNPLQLLLNPSTALVKLFQAVNYFILLFSSLFFLISDCCISVLKHLILWYP